MKTLSQFLFAAVILFATGCAAQKQTAATDVATSESAQLHQEALKALEGRMFIVRAEEFFLKPGERPVTSPESYLLMQGGKGAIHYAPNLFPSTDLDRLNVEDPAAEIKRGKTKKSGDIEFILKIEGRQLSWLNAEMILTLHAKSNKCTILLKKDRNPVVFTGTVLPYVE